VIKSCALKWQNIITHSIILIESCCLLHSDSGNKEKKEDYSLLHTIILQWFRWASNYNWMADIDEDWLWSLCPSSIILVRLKPSFESKCLVTKPTPSMINVYLFSKGFTLFFRLASRNDSRTMNILLPLINFSLKEILQFKSHLHVTLYVD
jgi:hypothetical protein